MSYTKEKAIKEAILFARKENFKAGDKIAHESYDYVCIFIRYEGENAIVLNKEGQEKDFPKKEIFDPTLARDVAASLYTLGYWREDGAKIVSL